MTSNRSAVTVTIVTYNSARFIRQCLEYVLAQDYPELEVIIVDNASTDQTPEILAAFNNRVRVILNAENMGFAAAQNQAIAHSSSDWVLSLNPDVRLTPDFVTMIVRAGEADDTVGSVSGKLLSMSPDFQIPAEPVLDSTGIYFTPALRHFDRASRQPDRGIYEDFEYVFGVTGAAALYRRRMIDDISIFGEFFDSAFFAYREDADVAWRAQLLGWKCLYTPQAVAYHVRSVLPFNRQSTAALLNMHSVKNRFLLRSKNITLRLWLRHFPAIVFRDSVVVIACLLREWTSLPALPLVIRQLPHTWAKRGQIMKRRRVTDDYIAAWFSWQPVSYPAPQIAAKLQAQQTASR